MQLIEQVMSYADLIIRARISEEEDSFTRESI